MEGIFWVFGGEVDKILFLTEKVVIKFWFGEFPGLHIGKF
jgi:hypothetical protein